MMKSQTYQAWVLAMSLTQTFHQSVNAAYYCGSNYNDAIASCNITCPSGLGYNVMSEENECPPHQPYCFGPDLPCKPPEENAMNVGFLNLVDLSDMLAAGENDTNATSNHKAASTGNETVSPSITPSPSMMSTNETNLTLAPSPVPSNETNVTLAPTPSSASNETNVTLAPTPAASNETNVTLAPTNETNVTVAPSPAPTLDELAFRQSMDNPQNMFCGSGWQNATDECNTNPDAIPCPMMVDGTANVPLECPFGLMCFTIGMSCTPVTPAPTDVPTLTPTSAAPTTWAPTSSPISADDEVNMYFCGSNLNEANELCSVWCRSGKNSDCPNGQRCFLNTSCNATELNITIGYDESLISEVPSVAPTTYKPTEDLNPNDYYCSDAWKDQSYDGDCGIPCPNGGNDECPDGQFCYGPLPLCTPVYKVGVSTKWCGSTFEDMSSKCATECPNGTDEECPDGETCWGESPCALKQSALADLAAMEGKLWCGKNYKDLVENCPKECPGGSDDECGDDMVCFDMSTEEMSCNETGVGIKDPVDPLHLWCGSTWNNVLEDCPKACPEGTDEECGAGMICYDLTESDLICRTPGIGVKEKGDPNERWCGADYNDMMSSCPRRCPGGSNDECPLGMSCFDGSPCVTEGVGLITAEEKDTTKMFCGSDYTDAMSCGTPCSSGSNDECDEGQTCWADVECLWGAQETPVTTDVEAFEAVVGTSSTMFADVEVTTEDEANDAESFDAEEPAETSSSTSAMIFSEVAMEEDEPEEKEFDYPTEQENISEQELQPEPSAPEVPEEDQEFDYPEETSETASSEWSKFEEVDMPKVEEAQEFNYPDETTETASSEWSKFEEVDMPQDEEAEFDYPTESNSDEEPPPEPAAEPAADDSEPQPPAEPAAAEPAAAEPAAAEPAAAEPAAEPQPQPEPEPSPETGLKVENVRIALYGISQLSADHINAWESLTEEYFERFYNEFSDPGDAIRSGVTDVDTIYEVTKLSVSTARRGLRLRSQRKLSDTSAYLFDYTQTTRYLSGSGIKLEEVLQYPFSSARKRAAYVQFLKNSDDLFKDLDEVSAVFLPQKFESTGSSQSFSSSTSGDTSGSSSSGNPFGEPPESSSSGHAEPAVALDKFSSFYCHNSGEACPSGTCDKDECIFVPESDPIPVGSYAPAPGSDSGSDADEASSMVSSVLSGDATPSLDQPVAMDSSSSSGTSTSVSSDSTDSSPSVSSPSGSSSSGGSSDSSNGSISVSTDSNSDGINVVANSEFSSVSVSQDSSTSSSSLNSFIESSSVSSPSSNSLSYSDAAYGPITVKGEMTLTGMEMIKVDNIFEWQYLTSIYEQEFYNEGISNGDYVRENVHNVATSFEIIEVHYGADSSDPITIIKFRQTIKYDTDDSDIPVSAIVTQPFLTPEYRENYIKYLRQMLPDSFGSLSTSSSVPEEVPEKNSSPSPVYEDLSETFFCGDAWPVDCQTAQSCSSGDMCPYGQTCFTAPMCLEEQNDADSFLTEETAESDMSQFSELISTPTTEKPLAEEIYPESTYFCGTSIEDAARTCGNPCPTRDSKDCPGEQQCFGNTKCEERESFFCGTSWLEASDKCSTPCPDGDASVCDEGEACFAWTACRNTESFYCGVSFQDASDNCAHPCESRSSLDCPEGMGCFAYTTCQGTNENAEHVVNPSSIPMSDFFCGATVEDAATKCATGGAIACQDDDQCPGDMKCFETTECSDRSTYFCGTSWLEAAETCSKPCSSGSSDQCGEGNSCFAHTGCQANNLFYCGMNFEDASETCGTPCESRSSEQCPGEQLCFAYVSACAEKSEAENISLGAFGDFSNFETPDGDVKEPEWIGSYWAGIEASSSPMRTRAFYMVVTSTLVMLYTFL